MHLIWSALWGTFPREVRLISEFLIPSLRTKAIAPHATPREAEGERQAAPPDTAGCFTAVEGGGWEWAGGGEACQVLDDTAT